MPPEWAEGTVNNKDSKFIQICHVKIFMWKFIYNTILLWVSFLVQYLECFSDEVLLPWVILYTRIYLVMQRYLQLPLLGFY